MCVGEGGREARGGGGVGVGVGVRVGRCEWYWLVGGWVGGWWRRVSGVGWGGVGGDGVE